MGQESVCPETSYWKVMKTAVDGDRLVLHLIPVRVWVACPLCGVPSRRIHSRYRRRALDLPWFSWPVQLIIQARRFFCDTPECERRIFVEPFPKALGRYARQTQRTRDSLLELSHCSSAEMAARVARLLGFVTSPDSLLRLQRLERFPAIFPWVLLTGVCIGFHVGAWRVTSRSDLGSGQGSGSSHTRLQNRPRCSNHLSQAMPYRITLTVRPGFSRLLR